MIFRKKHKLASKLKHQLILQQRNTSADGIGGFTRTWENVATLWAEIIPIGGGEKYAYEQQTNRQRFRIKLRYRSDIKPHMRLFETATGRAFDIKSVINTHEASQVTEILADVAFPEN